MYGGTSYRNTNARSVPPTKDYHLHMDWRNAHFAYRSIFILRLFNPLNGHIIFLFNRFRRAIVTLSALGGFVSWANKVRKYYATICAFTASFLTQDLSNFFNPRSYHDRGEKEEPMQSWDH